MSNAVPIYHYLKPSTKSLLRRNQTHSVKEEQTWSRAWEQGTGSWLPGSWGGERRESRGRGLSKYLHNQNSLLVIVSIYHRFLLNIVFRWMSLNPLKRKDLLQTLDPDLHLMLLSLTVLGVSVTSSVCSQALYSMFTLVLASTRTESFVSLRIWWGRPK